MRDLILQRGVGYGYHIHTDALYLVQCHHVNRAAGVVKCSFEPLCEGGNADTSPSCSPSASLTPNALPFAQRQTGRRKPNAA